MFFVLFHFLIISHHGQLALGKGSVGKTSEVVGVLLEITFHKPFKNVPRSFSVFPVLYMSSISGSLPLSYTLLEALCHSENRPQGF